MDKLTNQQVLDAGLADWRKLAQSLHARFLTGDFATGLAFDTASPRSPRRPATTPM